MSDLEREFEFEFQDEPAAYSRESSADDLDQEFETILSDDSDSEFEYSEDTSSPDADQYAQRLYELSQREFESESEVDEALNEVLHDMEADMFWGSIKKGFKSLASKANLKKLAGKAWKFAKTKVPALQAIDAASQLARGNLSGMLKSAMRAGLGAAVPGAAPFLPSVLNKIGFEATEDPADNREAWGTMTEVAREAYDYLASNITEKAADNPAEAAQLAAAAFQAGLRKAGSGRNGRRSSRRSRVHAGGARVIELSPGEEVIIRVRRG